jgi:hypothetical protein
MAVGKQTIVVSMYTTVCIHAPLTAHTNDLPPQYSIRSECTAVFLQSTPHTVEYDVLMLLLQQSKLLASYLLTCYRQYHQSFIINQCVYYERQHDDCSSIFFFLLDGSHSSTNKSHAMFRSNLSPVVYN